MGCDIHLYVERRVDGKWTSADKWSDDDYDKAAPKQVAYRDEFYSDRNYDLFAILANVRNGYGFAGVDTGAGFKPIAMPRGLPADVCEQIAVLSKSWGRDGHSHSWLTVAELMAFDWTQTTTRTGVVNAVEYEKWSRQRKSRNEFPSSFSGGVMGQNVRMISETEMAEKIAPIIKDRGDLKVLEHYYCQIEWHPQYFQCAENFIARTLPRLWRMGSFEDVRIVFWFDN